MTKSASAAAMGLREWMLLLLLSVLWGCSFFYFKVLVAELPPLTVVLGRVGLAAVLLNIILRLKGEAPPRSATLWRSYLVMGFLNNVVPFTLIAWGETRISSGFASILNATTPVFAVVVTHFAAGHEKLNWNKSAGALLGLLGVVVMVGRGALTGFRTGVTWGALACLAAACAYALAGVYGRRFKGMVPLQVATGQLTGSTILLIPLACLVDQPWDLPMPSARAWAAFAGLAVLSTVLAYILYFRLLAMAGATNVLLVTLLLPISALFLGAIFLGETITLSAIAGMTLIALALAAIDGRLVTIVRRRLSGLPSANS